MAQPVVHLITQYCNDPRPARAAEYDECFRRNLANPWVRAVHNLVEPQTLVPAAFRSHPKYAEKTVPRWLTFHDAFTYANAALAGQIVCLANLDIFLDDAATDWQAAARLLDMKIVLCLGRWEWKGDGRAEKDPDLAARWFANSQDAWVFRPPIAVPDCDFEMGLLGCENAIAERFKRTGLTPVNAPGTFRILHLDRVRGDNLSEHVATHQQERSARPPNRHPERQGHWLVPDIEALQSLDTLAHSLHLDPMQRYAAICDVLNRFAGVYNED